MTVGSWRVKVVSREGTKQLRGGEVAHKKKGVWKVKLTAYHLLGEILREGTEREVKSGKRAKKIKRSSRA